MKKKLLIIAMLMVGVTAVPLAASTVQAATPQEQLCRGSGQTPATDGGCFRPDGTVSLQRGFQIVVNVLLFIIGAVAVVMIVIGGMRYVLSNGDQSAVNSAKNTILYACVGLVVAILAYAIVNFVISAFV